MLTENSMFAGRYRLLKKIGGGGFSVVWKAIDTMAGNLIVAIKIYVPDNGMDEEGLRIFRDEFSLVFALNHTNLLRPTYYDICDDSPYLVLPFCDRGSAERLINPERPLPEKAVVEFIRDVAAALAYLHSQEPPIIHQDIKPGNVLLSNDGSYKVTDFGISTRMRSTLRKTVGASEMDKLSKSNGSGSIPYMGPERFSASPTPVKASDVWALGAAAFEIMTGDVPFDEMFGGSLQKNGADVPVIPGSYSKGLKKLVYKCLAKETRDRPTAARIEQCCNEYLETGKWRLHLLDPPVVWQRYRRKVIAIIAVAIPILLGVAFFSFEHHKASKLVSKVESLSVVAQQHLDGSLMDIDRARRSSIMECENLGLEKSLCTHIDTLNMICRNLQSISSDWTFKHFVDEEKKVQPDKVLTGIVIALDDQYDISMDIREKNIEDGFPTDVATMLINTLRGFSFLSKNQSAKQ